MTAGIAIVSYLSLPSEFTLYNFGTNKVVENWHLCFCVAIGLWLGLAIGYITEYYTSSAYSLAAMDGIAVAALGMLSTMATGLAIDAYGPISDNAGGIAEMTGMRHEIRERSDALDAAGNTTAAIGKDLWILTVLVPIDRYFRACCITASKGLRSSQGSCHRRQCWRPS